MAGEDIFQYVGEATARLRAEAEREIDRHGCGWCGAPPMTGRISQSIHRGTDLIWMVCRDHDRPDLPPHFLRWGPGDSGVYRATFVGARPAVWVDLRPPQLQRRRWWGRRLYDWWTRRLGPDLPG